MEDGATGPVLIQPPENVQLIETYDGTPNWEHFGKLFRRLWLDAANPVVSVRGNER